MEKIIGRESEFEMYSRSVACVACHLELWTDCQHSGRMLSWQTT